MYTILYTASLEFPLYSLYSLSMDVLIPVPVRVHVHPVDVHFAPQIEEHHYLPPAQPQYAPRRHPTLCDIVDIINENLTLGQRLICFVPWAIGVALLLALFGFGVFSLVTSL